MIESAVSVEDDRDRREGAGGHLGFRASSVLGGEAQMVSRIGIEPLEFGLTRSRDSGPVRNCIGVRYAGSLAGGFESGGDCTDVLGELVRQ